VGIGRGGSLEVDLHPVAVADPGQADADDRRLPPKRDLARSLAARASSSEIVFIADPPEKRPMIRPVMVVSIVRHGRRQTVSSRHPGHGADLMRSLFLDL
jgi:hypothetical protein